MVQVDATIDISIGLGMTILATVGILLKEAKEGIVSNASGLWAFIWYGASFLRGQGGQAPTQMKIWSTAVDLNYPRGTKGGSTPPPRTHSGSAV